MSQSRTLPQHGLDARFHSWGTRTPTSAKPKGNRRVPRESHQNEFYWCHWCFWTTVKISQKELQSKLVKKDNKHTCIYIYNYIQSLLQFLLFSSQVNVTSQSFCPRLRSFNRFEIDLAKANTTNLFRRNRNLWLRQLRPTGFCCRPATKVVAKGDVVGTSAGEWASVMTSTGWNCGNLLWLRSRQWG